MNLLDKNISVYRNVYDKEGVVLPLKTFLFSTRHIAEIEELRLLSNPEERKQIKLSLPQATISGVFKPQRKAEYLQEHSGLICLDFDQKVNEWVEEWDEAKAMLSSLAEVAYCSYSVGGKGLFAIIPLAYPQKHKAQFMQLSIDLKERFGLIADKACADVCRMRCLSYDSNPYVNDGAIPYIGQYYEPRREIKHFNRYDNDATIEKVMKCCREIEKFGIDITGNYNLWIQVGASLGTLGEDGRDAFHICSRQNPTYQSAKCDRKFDNVMRTCKRIGIGTFFHVCQMYGIDV